MAQQKPILVASNLHKSYPMGRGSVHVLKGIDLEVKEGEIGAVGCGQEHVAAHLGCP